jgi:hypothetical protein
MWATDATTSSLGAACSCQTQPSRTERYGGFPQASYKFDGWKQVFGHDRRALPLMRFLQHARWDPRQAGQRVLKCSAEIDRRPLRLLEPKSGLGVKSG